MQELNIGNRADLEQVVGLLATAWPIGSEYRLRQRIKAGTALRSRTIVERDPGTALIIGAAHISNDPMFPGLVGAIVVVAPQYRGEGLGTRMFEALHHNIEASSNRLLVLLRSEVYEKSSFAGRHGLHQASRSVQLEIASEAIRLPPLSSSVATVRRADRNVDGKLFLDAVQASQLGLPRASGDNAVFRADRTWKYYVSPQAELYIAEARDQVLGVGVLTPLRGQSTWYVDYTGVVPQFRSLGVATALKHAMLERVSPIPHQKVITYNEEHNFGMLAVNRKFDMVRSSGYVGLTRS